MPETAEQGAYSITKFEARKDRARVLELWDRFWNQASPGKRDLSEKFDWFYAGNPGGDPFVCELRAGGDPAGMSVDAPRQFVFKGMPVRGSLLMDFVVDPGHRSFFPAKLLQRSQHELALEHSEFLYGIPNERARKFLQRAKLGLSEIERPHVTTILRTAPYLRRVMPGWLARPAGALLDALIRVRDEIAMRVLPRMSADWLEEFDERFDDIWQQCQREANCIGVRDRRFLTWRFRMQPGRNCLILAIAPRDRPGQLQAYFVLETDGETLAIRDTLLCGSAAARTSAWFSLRKAARQLGARTITCHIACSRENRRAMQLAGFRRRGYTLMFFRGRPELDVAGAEEESFWHITEADEDI